MPDKTLSVNPPNWSILHIDPSPSVLALVRQELTSCWDRPIEITSFFQEEEAAAYVLYNTDIHFDAVIIDAGAGLDAAGARDFVVLLRDCHPGSPVILTRYADAPVDTDLRWFSDLQVLEKPFNALQLRTKVQKVLEKCSK